MNHSLVRVVGLFALTLIACGGSEPPPKTEEVATQPRHERPHGGPSVGQELGSIDQRAVEQTFRDLQTKLEVCHTKGRSRVDYLAGDVKVFMRIGKDGRVRYGWFEDSTLGDRDTEKCLLDTLAATNWPKPDGGEAEVRNNFGWPGGDERPPASWGPEKVTGALDESKAVKAAVAKCKAGGASEFHVTAYVEPGETEVPEEAPKHDGKGATPAKAGGKKGAHDKAEKAEAPKQSENHGGKFKAIGVVSASKEGAEKVECVVDALKNLSLPSPGSYAAKVTFTL